MWCGSCLVDKGVWYSGSSGGVKGSVAVGIVVVWCRIVEERYGMVVEGLWCDVMCCAVVWFRFGKWSVGGMIVWW